MKRNDEVDDDNDEDDDDDDDDDEAKTFTVWKEKLDDEVDDEIDVDDDDNDAVDVNKLYDSARFCIACSTSLALPRSQNGNTTTAVRKKLVSFGNHGSPIEDTI